MGLVDNSLSWIGDRLTAIRDNILGTPVALEKLGVSTQELGTKVASAVSSFAVEAGNGIKWVAENPHTALKEAGNYYTYTVVNSDRNDKLVLQGLALAAADTVGMIGDLGRWGGRGITNASLKFVGLEQYFIPKPEGSLAEAAQKAVTFTRAQNEYERVSLYGTQAAGEVGTFIGITVGTGGAAGAAWASARGTAFTAARMEAGAARLVAGGANAAKTETVLANYKAMVGHAVDTAAPRIAQKGFEFAKPWAGPFSLSAETGGAGFLFYAASTQDRTEAKEADTLLAASMEEAFNEELRKEFGENAPQIDSGVRTVASEYGSESSGELVSEFDKKAKQTEPVETKPEEKIKTPEPQGYER